MNRGERTYVRTHARTPVRLSNRATLLRRGWRTAAVARWAILCLRWSKSVRRLLSTSELGGPDPHTEKSDGSYDTLSQLAAWGIPAILTVIVLVARLVDADELFGAPNDREVTVEPVGEAPSPRTVRLVSDAANR
uniref:Frizzled/Smoothened 7TM domain-containing protein n=1 Tax=Anopheles albimanus TaxID=7167 RepID=A0A182F5Q9_ANOAL